MKKYLVTSVCTVALSLFGTLGFTPNALANVNSFNLNTITTQVEQSIAKTCPKTSAGIANANLNNGQVLTYKNINLSNCKSVKDVIITLRKNGCKKYNSRNIKKNQTLKNIIATIQNNNSAANNTNTAKPTTVPTPTTKPITTPQPTPTATASNSTSQSSFANQVLQLVNQERAKAGLRAYTTNSSLIAAANKRAQEIKQSFSHTRPNGTSCFTVLPEYNISYNTAGENIAYGQRTPQEVVTGWMNSPGHRANILNGNFGKIGIGVYQSNGVYYWTQEFTN